MVIKECKRKQPESMKQGDNLEWSDWGGETQRRILDGYPIFWLDWTLESQAKWGDGSVKQNYAAFAALAAPAPDATGAFWLERESGRKKAVAEEEEEK